VTLSEGTYGDYLMLRSAPYEQVSPAQSGQAAGICEPAMGCENYPGAMGVVYSGYASRVLGRICIHLPLHVPSVEGDRIPALTERGNIRLM
jgi:hypothetical protein